MRTHQNEAGAAMARHKARVIRLSRAFDFDTESCAIRDELIAAGRAPKVAHLIVKEARGCVKAKGGSR